MSPHNQDRFFQNQNGHGEGCDNYYTLSFEYRFESGSDEVWFAHAVPYTYSGMNANLKEFCDLNPSKVRAEVLAVSLGGLPVPLLTITEDVGSYLKYSE